MNIFERLPSSISFNHLVWCVWFCVALLTMNATWFAQQAGVVNPCSTAPGLCPVPALGTQHTSAWGVWGLLVLWFFVFGLYWGWLRARMYLIKKNSYDFIADQYDALLIQWRQLILRQLAFWFGGSAWCGLHLMMFFVDSPLGVLLLSACDTFGICFITFIRSKKHKPLQFSPLVARQRQRFIVVTIAIWVLAWVWLSLEYLLMATGQGCNNKITCLQYLWEQGWQDWPLGIYAAIVCIQLGIWGLTILNHYKNSMNIQDSTRIMNTNQLDLLRFGMPVLLCLSIFIPHSLLFVIATGFATAGLLLIGVWLRVIQATPIDSLGTRVRINHRFQHWLQNTNLQDEL